MPDPRTNLADGSANLADGSANPHPNSRPDPGTDGRSDHRPHCGPDASAYEATYPGANQEPDVGTD